MQHFIKEKLPHSMFFFAKRRFSQPFPCIIRHLFVILHTETRKQNKTRLWD